MKIKQLINILLIAFCFSGCVCDNLDTPEESDDVILTVGFSTDGYSAGLTRSEEDLCWSDWNENKIEYLDFYLLDAEGKISFHRSIQDDADDSGAAHTLLEFKGDGKSSLEGLTFELLNSASRIAMVANYPLDLTSEARLDKTFDKLYSGEVQFAPGQYMQRQEKFVMVGFFDLPEKISKYSNIVVPLRRIIAKIRVRVKDSNDHYLDANKFQSVLCRYSESARILPDDLMPAVCEDGKTVSSKNIYPANVTPSGMYSGLVWSYPEDITDPHPENMVSDNGHVYYTCPSDWVDYSKVKKECTRLGNKGHNDDAHNAGLRYEITDYDDAAPILPDREMFLFIKAPYAGSTASDAGNADSETENTESDAESTEPEPKEYIYRIPVNYRISTINDQQCFSVSELTDSVFSLYRVQRNHFYDITVLLDRPGEPIGQKSEVRGQRSENSGDGRRATGNGRRATGDGQRATANGQRNK